MKEITEILKLYKSMGVNYIIDDIENIIHSDNQVKAQHKSPEINQTPTAENINNVTVKPVINTVSNLNKTVVKVNKEELDYNLDGISSFEGWKQAIDKYEGCDLKQTAINTVYGAGNSQSPILIIGEAPGEEEDETGQPFMGRSGKLLTDAIGSIGIKREDAFITNCVYWRPPANMIKQEHISQCSPFVKKLVDIIKPKLIILVGRSAFSSLLDTSKPMSTVVGKWLDYNNILVRVVYHPAFLIRSYTYKKVFWRDLVEIKNKIKQEKIEL